MAEEEDKPERDELAESLDDLFSNLSTMIKGELQELQQFIIVKIVPKISRQVASKADRLYWMTSSTPELLNACSTFALSGHDSNFHPDFSYSFLQNVEGLNGIHENNVHAVEMAASICSSCFRGQTIY